jgi:competence protein ComGC
MSTRARNTNAATVLLIAVVALIICILALIIFDAIGGQDEAATITTELRETHGITITEAQAFKLESGRETEVVGADGELIRIRVVDHANIGEHPKFETSTLLGK